jgi:alpha-tubulin suppressor-like RCC1 family protein
MIHRTINQINARALGVCATALALGACVQRVDFTDADFRDRAEASAPTDALPSEGGSPTDVIVGDAAEAGNESDASVPTCPRDRQIAKLRVGDGASCVVRANGYVWCWGVVPPSDSMMVPTRSATPRSVRRDVVDVTVEATFWCSIDRVSTGVTCWGANPNGQLGLPAGMAIAFPNTIIGVESVVQIQSSATHVCALSAGSATETRIRCWGDPSENRLGPRADMTPHVPMEIASLPMGVNTLAIDGTINYAASLNGSTLFGWGQNSSELRGGAFPIPDNGSTVAPRRVSLPDTTTVGALAVASTHACFVDATSRQVFCAGSGLTLALGASAPDYTRTWQRVEALNMRGSVTHLAVGGDRTVPRGFTCAAVETAPNQRNTVYCIGDNTHGQLGIDSMTPTSDPQQITLPSGSGNITELAASPGHVCALTDRDRVYCWGRNCEGESGVMQPGVMVPNRGCTNLRVQTPTEVQIPCE